MTEMELYKLWSSQDLDDPDLKKELEEMDAGLDIKQSAKMRAFQDNMQAMYGVDPYKV